MGSTAHLRERAVRWLRARLRRTRLVRRIARPFVRELLEAEVALGWSSLRKPGAPHGGDPRLTVILVAGSERLVLIRALQILAASTPAGGRIVVAAAPGRAHGRRLFLESAHVSFVEVAAGASEVEAVATALEATHVAAHVLVVPACSIPGPDVVAQALAIASEPASQRSVHAGMRILDDGEVGLAESESRVPLGGSRTDPLDSLRQVRGAATEVDRCALLAPTDLMRRCCASASPASSLGAVVAAGARAAGIALRYDPRLAVLDLEPVLEPRDVAARPAERSPAPGPPPRAILMIEDRAPHPSLGRGYPRSHRMIETLRQMGYAVTLYPTHQPGESIPSAYDDIPRDVEIVLRRGPGGLGRYLEETRGRFDLVVVARPHNMTLFREASRPPASAAGERSPPSRSPTPFVYDAEALFTLRQVALAQCGGRPMAEDAIAAAIAAEVELADGAAAVIAVSDRERDEFTRRGIRHAVTLGHALEVVPTPKAGAERAGILFVGALDAANSPNVDGIEWFLDNVLPVIRSRLGPDELVVRIAGEVYDAFRIAHARPGVEFLGVVPDLRPLYDASRLFIAPTRFSAGIPLKVIEAAAHGLPVVATALHATQLGWTDGVDLLTSDTPDGFAAQCISLCDDAARWEAVRAAALTRVADEASVQAFRHRLEEVVRCALDASPPPSEQPVLVP